VTITPAALRDETGHYRLAIEPKLRGLTDPQLVEAWRYVQSPLGGYRPLPQALRFHRSPARFRFALGGNRSSKSHALAVETMWWATGLHPFRDIPGPTEGWYATTTWDKVGDTLWSKLKVLLRGIRHQVIWHNKQRDIPNTIIVPRGSAGDSKIILKAFEQGRESFQAAALDYAHFDEQFPQDVFVETVTRIGPGKAVNFAAAMTPIESQPWLEGRLTSSEPDANDDVFEFPLDDNRISQGGFIADELIDATIENWPPEVRDTRRFGKWGAFLGAIFQTYSRELHVVSEERERRLFFLGKDHLPYAWPAIGGIDWGGNNPFVFLWACRIPHLDNDYYVFDEYYWSFKERGPRLLADHAKEILARTEKWNAMLSHTWADHDPTDAREMAEHGVPSRPAVKDVDAGIETIQSLLFPRRHLANGDWPNGRPRLHIAKRCKNLLRELPMYRWKEATDKQDAKREPVKKDDHSVDDLRYIVHSEKPYDPRPGGPAKRADLGGGNRRSF
jgi:phage terminase large subunit-like protein